MNKKYLFISDIHLGLQSKEIEDKKEKLLVKFLNETTADCDELFIIGDLFDYWFEYKYVYQKGFYRTLTALKDLTEKGIVVHYFIGNHDFMHQNFFTNEIGTNLYEDAVHFVLNGKKFFIAHGDGLVKNDIGYKILKSILRNKVMQWFYGWLHPDIGVWLAKLTSKSSRDYTTQKDYGKEDGLFETAKNKIDEGFDYILFGHEHLKKDLQYKNGRYINLGSWLDKPCYGKFENNNFEIIDIING